VLKLLALHGKTANTVEIVKTIITVITVKTIITVITVKTVLTGERFVKTF